MINQCIHCGKNIVTFKACRINGSAYIEQFINQTPIRCWKETHDIPRDDWDKIYEEFRLEAEKLTQEFETGDASGQSHRA